MRGVRQFLRANPQVFVLLMICLVLGLGTFLAVVFGIVSSGSNQVSGDPNDSALGIIHAAFTAVGRA